MKIVSTFTKFDSYRKKKFTLYYAYGRAIIIIMYNYIRKYGKGDIL